MSEKQIAQEIQNRAAELNSAMQAAAEQGIRVDVEVVERPQVMGHEDPPPFVQVRSYKCLG